MKKKNTKQPREHVLYLGDWVFHLGPIFIETPFGTETKDADLHFYGSRLVEALEPLAEITFNRYTPFSMPCTSILLPVPCNG